MHGQIRIREKNNEGQAVVDFAKRRKLAITNSYFVKKSAHRVTYCSGGRSSQADYIMARRQRIKEVVDTKVVIGENVAKQHRIVVSAIISGQSGKSTKTSEENKMAEIKGLESEQ